MRHKSSWAARHDDKKMHANAGGLNEPIAPNRILMHTRNMILIVRFDEESESSGNDILAGHEFLIILGQCFVEGRKDLFLQAGLFAFLLFSSIFP
jgi:hypothetical protein